MPSLVTIDAEVLLETQLAVMVENLDGEKVWLPKSQIEVNGDEIELPEWLATDKELI